MAKVAFPVIIEGIASKKDRSVKITLVTREFSPEESAVLFSLRGAEAYALFATEALKEEDVPEDPLDMPKGKSASQRLRAVLYILWQHRGSKGTFSEFYESKVESWIDKIKEMLDE